MVTLKNETLRCPTCGRLVAAEEENRPFCSDRCRLIDLGKWASGAYRISSPILDPDIVAGLPGEAAATGGHDERD